MRCRCFGLGVWQLTVRCKAEGSEATCFWRPVNERWRSQRKVAALPLRSTRRTRRRRNGTSASARSRCWTTRSSWYSRSQSLPMRWLRWERAGDDQAANLSGLGAPSPLMANEPSPKVLFGFDARRLDDRPPLLDVGFLQRTEGFGCLLLARRNLILYIGEPLTHRRVCEGIHDGSIELGDDVLRRALWRKNRKPLRTVEPGQSRLVHCRDVGRIHQATHGGDGISVDSAGTHLR